MLLVIYLIVSLKTKSSNFLCRKLLPKLVVVSSSLSSELDEVNDAWDNENKANNSVLIYFNDLRTSCCFTYVRAYTAV